mmetsp:Transcript_28710/g.49015  ORF Transcript_28710/g.49015 Transcript_28710/m.49015 type:complete len:244 (+) Transcript_28710:873-1604(+)
MSSPEARGAARARGPRSRISPHCKSRCRWRWWRVSSSWSLATCPSRPLRAAQATPRSRLPRRATGRPSLPSRRRSSSNRRLRHRWCRRRRRRRCRRRHPARQSSPSAPRRSVPSQRRAPSTAWLSPSYCSPSCSSWEATTTSLCGSTLSRRWHTRRGAARSGCYHHSSGYAACATPSSDSGCPRGVATSCTPRALPRRPVGADGHAPSRPTACRTTCTRALARMRACCAVALRTQSAASFRAG